MNSNTSNIEVVALPNFVISGFNNPAICGTSTGDITLSGLTPLTGYSLSYLDDGVPVGPLAIVTDAFGDYVSFCCGDIGNNAVVLFRVYDQAGNRNDCWMAGRFKLRQNQLRQP